MKIKNAKVEKYMYATMFVQTYHDSKDAESQCAYVFQVAQNAAYERHMPPIKIDQPYNCSLDSRKYSMELHHISELHVNVKIQSLKQWEVQLHLPNCTKPIATEL
jgi:hypothetical protein